MDVIDFDALNAELDLAPDITSALPTEEDIISDLLADIEQQSVDELELDTIEAKGVTSESQANFLIRRYKRLKDTAQKINDTADEELRKYADKVNNWRDNELKSLGYQMDYIQGIMH